MNRTLARGQQWLRGWSLEAFVAGAAVGAWALRHRYRTLRDIAGQVVLITGGSRGLGFVLAQECARQGARVAICARDAAELAAAQERLAALEKEVLVIPCDITDRAQAAEVVRRVTDVYGRIDILINNAGVITVGPVLAQSIADFERVLATNFWGALYLIDAVLPQMLARHQGTIVNITSIGGKVSVPHLLPYTAAKFALTGYSEGLHAELAREGIQVLTVAPGLMRTGSQVNTQIKGQHRAEYTLFTLLDSLPGMSMNAREAAWQIVEALRLGRTELLLSMQTKVAARFMGLFPNITTWLLTAVNSVLPRNVPGGDEIWRGADCETPLTRSFLTALSQHAAQENNELVGLDTRE